MMKARDEMDVDWYTCKHARLVINFLGIRPLFTIGIFKLPRQRCPVGVMSVKVTNLNFQYIRSTKSQRSQTLQVCQIDLVKMALQHERKGDQTEHL